MSEADVISIKSPLKLITTKEINGMWYADLNIRSDDYIDSECYVEFEGELYIAKKIDKIKDSGGNIYFKVRLEHLMTELNDYTIESFNQNNVTAEDFLTFILTGTTWSIGTVANLGNEDVDSDRRITVLEAISKGVGIFGGELYFNQDRTVDWKSTIGTSTKAQIRYDKNSDYIERRQDTSKLVTRLYPYGEDNITINTQLLENCDKPADWETSDEDNFNKAPDSVDRKQGSASIKITALITDSLNDTITRDFGAGSEIDISGHDLIKFWIKSSRTGTNLQIGIGESAWDDNTHNIEIDTANKWQEEEWDISGIADADKNAIRYIGLKCTNADAANTIRFDYIRAFDGDIFLESANLADYKNPKEVALFTTFSDPDELKAYAQDYLDLYDSPIYSYKVNTADLTSMPKWVDEVINIGDTVRLYDSDLGLNVDCRVKKIVKDLLDPTKLKLELTNSIENAAFSMADYYQKLSYSMPFHNDETAVNAASVRIGYLASSVIRTNSIFANHYNQLRNVLPFNFDDSLDSSYPLECEFFMPPNTDEIKSAWVHIVGRNFRAYSKGAASGGGQTSSSGGGQTTSSGGGQTSSGGTAHSHSISGQTASYGSHSHDISDYEANTTAGGSGIDVSGNTGGQSDSDVAGNSGETSGHTHTSGSYYKTAHTHSSGSLAVNGTHIHTYRRALLAIPHGYHEHSITGATSSSESSHTHTVANHTHTVSDHTHTVSNHTHNLTFGIYESTDPTGVNIYVDDGDGYGSSLASDDTPVEIDVNIASSLSATSGWKKIRITSSRLGRVVVVLMLDITLSSV